MLTPRITLNSVSKSFHSRTRVVKALHEISFTVMPGEFVTIIGPSGSGKSTLFNILAGLLQPDGGVVEFDSGGAPPGHVGGPSGHVCYMPQRDLLLPWRKVIDNAALPLRLGGVRRAEARERVQAELETFGLVGFEHAYPSQLSGGMRQRAALLRTVMTGRPTLLLDEPFGALDALTRRQLQDWLLRLHARLNRTIVFITHDIDEAVYLADRVIVMSARPGRVIHELSIDLSRPRHQNQVADPEFGRYVSNLVADLGLDAAATTPRK